MSEDSHIYDLRGRGDKILEQNLSEAEKVLVKLQGDFGQALTLTDKRIYIVKWGFQAGQTFGGKCIAYEYRNITAVELRKHMLSRLFVVLTPATQDNNKLSYWGGRGGSNNATESECAVTFPGRLDAEFQYAANLARQMISRAHTGTTTMSSHDDLDKLERLAVLKEKGIVTEQEFQAKKRQLLGL